MSINNIGHTAFNKLRLVLCCWGKFSFSVVLFYGNVVNLIDNVRVYCYVEIVDDN